MTAPKPRRPKRAELDLDRDIYLETCMILGIDPLGDAPLQVRPARALHAVRGI